MTFDEATTFANESGWYIHQLWQEGSAWGCVVRESEGGPRRAIAQGRGDSAEEAIMEALSVAPELEPEIGIIAASGDAIPDLLARLVGAKASQPARTRA